MNQFFYNVLGWIQSGVGSWGVAMIIFTILIRLLLTPLDIKSRVSMRKTQKLQPMQQALQKKYANDKDKLNAKMAELYKKEHINPLSSCLPLLLTWPVLIIIFGAMRMAANEQLLNQVVNIIANDPVNHPVKLEQFLWIKNLWMPDNIFSCAYPTVDTLRTITDANLWNDFVVKLNNIDPDLIGKLNLVADPFTSGNLADTATKIVEYMQSLGTYDFGNSSTTVNLLIAQWTIPNVYNGLLLLPLLSGLSQVVMTKITTGNQPQQPAANGAPNTGKFMQWFFPIFSVVICLGYSAIFALYWVTGNLLSMAQTIIINKVLDKKEQMAAPVAGEGSIR